MREITVEGTALGMGNYYLAVDIGASSGRHMLAWTQQGHIRMQEVHRFENGLENRNGSLCWNVERLYAEIIRGLQKCAEIGKIPVSMGIDTWGVDFVLLDSEDRMLGHAVGYRDSRTEGMDREVYKVISREELYERTGIQKQIFNTIFQLMAVKKQQPELMEQAKSMLMIPDYFHFLLTGVKKMEYTNATTGQLVHAGTNEWDYELIERLGYQKTLFQPLSMPGTVVGNFTKRVREAVGFDCQVVLPATHDTGSAVLAVPVEKQDVIYISSGTWSLMGIERTEADCSEKSRRANFTNEGGYNHRYRYLKNIMGLWMIQSVRKEFNGAFSFAKLCRLASETSISSIVDVNDLRFLAPKSMIKAVQRYCVDTMQKIPETEGEIAAVIYNSLAKCYGTTIREIEQLTGRNYSAIAVVGGGSNAEYLNRLTARYTGKPVLAGPSEATAIGNIIVQLLQAGELHTLQEARKAVRESFEIQEYSEDAI